MATSGSQTQDTWYSLAHSYHFSTIESERWVSDSYRNWWYPTGVHCSTTAGAGACTTALVDFLTLIHNDFIERCRSLTSSQGKKYTTLVYTILHNLYNIILYSATSFINSFCSALQAVWSEFKVPITLINHCHVVYEQQPQSILLSHCHYSLIAGSSHIVKHELEALEKHLLDQFIQGKPMILADIPQVTYRKDTYIHICQIWYYQKESVTSGEAMPPHVTCALCSQVQKYWYLS